MMKQKFRICFLPLLAALCLSLLTELSLTQTPTIQVTVTNPISLERKSETISVSLKQISRYDPSLLKQPLRVVDAESGAEMLTQVTDSELLFQTDFRASETKQFLIAGTKASASSTESLVTAMFVPGREDLAWENDRIAFRMYGPALAKDVSNGIDVWTKRVRYPIVKKWYDANAGNPAGKDSYHEDHGEGADFFSVGKTLGCGSSGIWMNDTLYQPGVYSEYKILLNGPVRTSFELKYDHGDASGVRYTEVKTVSFDAGQNLNRIDIVYSFPHDHDSVTFAAGLVKRNGVELVTDNNSGWISFWGPTNNDPVNESLGTGVVIPSEYFRGTLEYKSHALIKGIAGNGMMATYYSGAGWTRSGDFGTSTDWNTYLSEFSARLRAPLQVSLSKSEKR